MTQEINAYKINGFSNSFVLATTIEEALLILEKNNVYFAKQDLSEFTGTINPTDEIFFKQFKNI